MENKVSSSYRGLDFTRDSCTVESKERVLKEEQV